ncbi:uncharacterized protein LOC116938179, partial [Petromyzon marinus]|uniref:uncharacterized protein LOC116938179 n=1 Tax=Petromyzon marinus TaxID=7757 RepID=UPI003F6EBA1F
MASRSTRSGLEDAAAALKEQQQKPWAATLEAEPGEEEAGPGKEKAEPGGDGAGPGEEEAEPGGEEAGTGGGEAGPGREGVGPENGNDPSAEPSAGTLKADGDDGGGSGDGGDGGGDGDGGGSGDGGDGGDGGGSGDGGGDGGDGGGDGGDGVKVGAMEAPNRGDAGSVCAVIPPDQQLYTESFCGVCQSQLQPQLSQEHYLSKKHAQKVRNYIFNQGLGISTHTKGKRQREQLLAPPAGQQQQQQGQQEQQQGQQQQGQEEEQEQERQRRANLYCSLCNVTFTSPANARSHYAGRPHAKKQQKRDLMVAQQEAQQEAEQAAQQVAEQAAEQAVEVGGEAESGERRRAAVGVVTRGGVWVGVVG